MAPPTVQPGAPPQWRSQTTVLSTTGRDMSRAEYLEFYAAPLAAIPAAAQSTDQPYAGKTVNMIIGFGAGGGYDRWARVIGRHIGKHLPGKPSVIPQNMPGAGGMIMFSHLYSRAKPDGLTVGIFPPGAFTRQILQEDTKFDMGKMPIVWAVSAAGATIVRDFLKARTARDLLRVDPSQIVLAARSAEEAAAIDGMLRCSAYGRRRASASAPGAPWPPGRD